MELKLVAKTKQETIIKDYLESNVSEALAEKINNGVKVEKDGKTLISKKSLAGCMNYIYEEARKQAKNNVAVIEDQVVFGWAVHYFEEDSIGGGLFNEDGTEYKSEKAKVDKPKKANMTAVNDTNEEEAEETDIEPVVQKEKATKQVNPQLSLFDMLG